MRRFAFVIMLALPFTPAFAETGTVSVYGFPDAIAPAVLDAFTKETGIVATFDAYTSEDAAEKTLRASGSGFDVALVSGPLVRALSTANRLGPLDPARLANRGGLDSQIAQNLRADDPAGRFAINYTWGSFGLGVNVDKVREVMGPAPLDSWGLLFRPDMASRLKSCGIHVSDAQPELFASALAFLKLKPDSRRLDDTNRAGELLFRLRANMQSLGGSRSVNALANGDICMLAAPSGDVMQAKIRAEEAGNGVTIAYILPREGAPISLDNFVMTADAKNVDAAYRFIDFMLKPHIAAMNAEHLAAASGVSGVKALLPAKMRDDPAIYPPDGAVNTLFTIAPYDERTQRIVDRLWARVKTGR
jgi:putrescine transport system substrate-binding protein